MDSLLEPPEVTGPPDGATVGKLTAGVMPWSPPVAFHHRFRIRLPHLPLPVCPQDQHLLLPGRVTPLSPAPNQRSDTSPHHLPSVMFSESEGPCKKTPSSAKGHSGIKGREGPPATAAGVLPTLRLPRYTATASLLQPIRLGGSRRGAESQTCGGARS